jgi:hypothetical protein
MSRAWIICKKIFSITLVFNALLTIAWSVGIIAGFYLFYPGWQPFSPYLLNGNLFWVVIAAAALNIYPSALVGRKLHTGRFLFHHYFYGLLVLVSAGIYVVLFTSESLVTIFLVNNTSPTVNVGRFFLLGGLALLLDDLPDVSKKIESALNWLKSKVYSGGKIVAATQLVCGAVSLYLLAAVTWAIVTVPEWVTAANIILIISVLITAVTSLIFVKRRAWRGNPAD